MRCLSPRRDSGHSTLELGISTRHLRRLGSELDPTRLLVQFVSVRLSAIHLLFGSPAVRWRFGSLAGPGTAAETCSCTDSLSLAAELPRPTQPFSVQPLLTHTPPSKATPDSNLLLSHSHKLLVSLQTLQLLVSAYLSHSRSHAPALPHSRPSYILALTDRRRNLISTARFRYFCLS